MEMKLHIARQIPMWQQRIQKVILKLYSDRSLQGSVGSVVPLPNLYIASSTRVITYPESNYLESKMATKLYKVPLFRIELYRIENDNFIVNLETKIGCITRPLSPSKLAFLKTCRWPSSGTSLRLASLLHLWHYRYSVTIFLLFRC